jgi:hypothetical protein
MLNKDTQKILRDLSTISTTAIVSHPITGIQDIDRSIVAFINVEDMGEAEFEDFGLMSISEFLNVIDLVDDADIEIENRIATIKNSSTTTKYYTTDISIIEEAYGTKPAILDNIDKAIEAATFEISAEQLSKLGKTSNALKVNDLVIRPNKDGGLELDITDSLKSDSNTMKTIIDGECQDSDMEIVIDMNNIRKIPGGSYSIRVAKNPKSGSYITKWTSLDLPSLQIVVSLAAR